MSALRAPRGRNPLFITGSNRGISLSYCAEVKNTDAGFTKETSV
jgi:hypothetical protein